MTKYHELEVNANKTKKRVGRGIAAGQGKTAGRGTKGQNSRTGKKLRATFMGGQRALVQAIPKARGFKTIRKPAQAVYTKDLDVLKGKTADNHSMFEAGLIKNPYHTAKIIVKGELKAKVTVKTQFASKSAQEAITKAGGSFDKVPVPLRKSQKPEAEKPKAKKPVKK